MNILLTYNPVAGNFRPQLLDQLSAALEGEGHTVSVCESHSADLKTMAAGCQHICVIGGDGTLRDVAALVSSANPRVIFSQFPLGTINLVAREAGYSKNIDKMVAKIGASKPARIHYSARNNEDMFLACASIGPDSWSVSHVSPALKKRIGRLAYGAAFLRQFVKWKRQSLTIVADGKSYQAEAAYLLKGKFFAGPWVLQDTALLTSDKLSVLLLPRARRLDFIQLMASALISKRFASRNWIRMECKDVVVSSNEQTPVQADGDFIGNLPMHFAMNPRQILFA